MKCYLCGYEEEEENMKELNGKKLCEQCYRGEVGNPEHKVV